MLSTFSGKTFFALRYILNAIYSLRLNDLSFLFLRFIFKHYHTILWQTTGLFMKFLVKTEILEMVYYTVFGFSSRILNYLKSLIIP